MTAGETTSMFGESGILFAVHNAETGVWSQAWNITTRSTSFYLTPSGGTVAVKFSLHGPDDRAEISDPGYKLDVVKENYSKAVANGAAVLDFGNYLPKWFPGVAVNENTTHVIRFLYRAALFTSDVLTFPAPTITKSATLHSRISAPTDEDQAVYLDVYVATGRPYFGVDEQATRDANAGLGPLTNSARQYLTVISRQYEYSEADDPWSEEYTSSDDVEEEAQRVTAMKVDDQGLMWISEVMMPRSMLEDPEYQYKPPPKTKPQTKS